MQIAKVYEASELTRLQKAFVIRFVRRAYGLNLAIKRERLILVRRFKRDSFGAKVIVSQDLRLGASLYFARQIAKKEKLGIFGRAR